MTIKELINQLKQFDDNLPIVLSGYEGGVYLPSALHEVVLAENVNQAWYYGPHERVVEGYHDYPEHKKFTGVHLS